MFICTIAPLLPVSIVETPSIMTVVDWTIEPSRWACTPFMTTPGASCASCRKLRFCIGRFWTVSVGIVKDRSPLAVWICGASLLTVTVSAVPPTSIVRTPTATRGPGLTAMPDCLRVLNDVSSTSMV